jgi:predicted metal-dependent phosphoesterase TrpH
MSGPQAPSAERLIRVDLHNHTYYSPDSILSPRRFVYEARRRGLDVVAVTDHNTIRGALAVRELSEKPIIIGEEIKSADGEILGLFLSEEVPKGLPAKETIARIKEQGGLVGVPHPFDSLRSALKEDVMVALIDQIDFIEALNARMVFSGHNHKAREFATTHALPTTAGSDAHSPWEVGQCYVEMPRFEGPADFIPALRQARLKGRLSTPFVHVISRYAYLRRTLGWKPPDLPSPAHGRGAGGEGSC